MRPFSKCQVPATTPSTRNVFADAGFFAENRSRRYSSGRTPRPPRVDEHRRVPNWEKAHGRRSLGIRQGLTREVDELAASLVPEAP